MYKFKRVMLPIFIAFVTSFFVFGISAFKSKEKALTTYKWFQVNTNKLPNATIVNAEVTYLGEGATPPSGTGCSGSMYQCVSGFTASQVNSSNQIIGSQVPATTPSRKN